MTVTKDQLPELVKSIQKELGIDLVSAGDLVAAELNRGTAPIDVFDEIVDRHCEALFA